VITQIQGWKRCLMLLSFVVVMCPSVLAREKEQSQAQLPPGFVALVPEGAEVSSPMFMKMPRMMAQVQFHASKNAPPRDVVMYSLDFRCFDTSSPAWGMQSQIYQTQLTRDVARKRQEMSKPLSTSGVTFEPVTEKKYPWGTALIQRRVVHFSGVEGGRGRNIVYYNTAYFGTVGPVMFELTAIGVPDSPDAASRWAEKVADKASKTGLGNIGE
jgi:hypothetical protein